MPLPPALLAKLTKRGLVTVKPNPEVKSITSARGFEGCPNKYNIYHECTKYCITRWKVGVLEANAKLKKNRDKMLKKYPLTPNWKEIYDRGCGRYYYWDMDKDLVSWLPPKHPRANLSYSAAYMREELQIRLVHYKEKQDEDKKRLAFCENKKEKNLSKNILFKSHKKISLAKEHLDPMDPAAYSDIPRGTWSAGLETRTDAKTGVDTTATGPLFQMRPYPSPGIVLAANLKKKTKFDE